MSFRFKLIASISLILTAIAASPSDAQSWFERLVMPGELIEGHKKLEKDCSNCHTSFSKKSQRKQCMDCHKDVARDVRKKPGFMASGLKSRQKNANSAIQSILAAMRILFCLTPIPLTID